MRDVIGSAGIGVMPPARGGSTLPRARGGSSLPGARGRSNLPGAWSRALVLLAAIAMLLVGVAGCRPAPDTGPAARLASELPADLWAAIDAEFTFDEEVTARLREMNADLLGVYPDEFDVQWWAFSREGSVAEAYAALPVPADSAPVEPFEASAGDLVAEHLEFWADELADLRDAAWHVRAESKAAEWAGVRQTVAEFGLATGSHAEAEATDWSAVFADADGDPELELATWVFSVVSPIVDLERLEVVEGTYLIVRVLDTVY